MRSATRGLASATLTVLASLAILVTLLANYANHVLLNSSGFADRAVSVVRTGPVESLIVNTVTSRLLAYTGDQSSLQPIIEEAAREALSERQITGQVRSAAVLLQSELTSGHANALTLTLPDVGTTIASSIASTSPQLAEVVTRIGTITVVDVPIPSSASRAMNDLATLGQDSSLLFILTGAIVVLALIVSPNRRRTLLGLGLGTLASGVVAVAIYLVGRGLVVDQFSSQDARTAAQTAWSVYLGGLESSGFVLAAAGVGVATVAALANWRHGSRRREFVGV